MRKELSFENLVANVSQIQELTSGRAKNAVNQLLTVRNWAIGFYIVEYEQNGADRAKYGDNLLDNLAKKINIKGLNRPMLVLCRSFYLKYPQIRATVTRRFGYLQGAQEYLIEADDGMKTLEKSVNEICATVSHKFETDPEVLISRLSFSHIREILHIDDPLERYFYETECIKGVWSVRELRRQIASKLYFRAGISKKPELLLDRIQRND